MLTARPTPATRASRRAVLGGGTAAGAALLATTSAGCGAEPSADGPAGPPVDSDSDLVGAISAQITEAATLALATGTAVPALRPLSRRFSALHTAHLRELGQDDDAPGGKVGGSPATAKARLLRSEERLQQRLVKAALDAESGALAQVFASMAAAIAQERAGS